MSWAPRQQWIEPELSQVVTQMLINSINQTSNKKCDTHFKIHHSQTSVS